MTDKQQPDPLSLAAEVRMSMPYDALKLWAAEAAAGLRRLHAESEMRRAALLDEMQKAARLDAELETLRAGYDAARLEIESLQARIKTMAEEHADELTVAHLDGRMRVAQPAGEYPALPKPGHRGPEGAGRYFDSFTADQMRAYVDADRAMRAAQPAGAQQPGAAYAVYAELPDERAAFEARFPVPGGASWNGSEYVVEDDYLNSYRCDRFVGQWAAWQARASHGQAPAQAAPAAVARPRRATKAVQQLGAGDAVFAFASMLTALPRVVPFGSAAWATPGAELATAFNAANGLSVSLDFPSEIVFPKVDGDLLAVIEKAAAPQPASPSYTHADVLEAHPNGYELGMRQQDRATKPAPAAQVDRADAVNLARNTLTQHDRAITKKGVSVLAEAVLSMDAALITQQPTQPQAEPKSGVKSFQTYGEANAYSKGYYAGKKAATRAQAGAMPLTVEQVTAAAKTLAACMDYPWDHMPAQGREEMRKHAQAVIEAAHGIKGGQHE